MKSKNVHREATPDYPSAIRLPDVAQHSEAERPSVIGTHPGELEAVVDKVKFM